MNYAFELRRIIMTLNGVEVKGKENMDRLLGSVIHLEAMAAAMEKEQAAAAKPVAPEAEPANK